MIELGAQVEIYFRFSAVHMDKIIHIVSNTYIDLNLIISGAEGTFTFTVSTQCVLAAQLVPHMRVHP